MIDDKKIQRYEATAGKVIDETLYHDKKVYDILLDRITKKETVSFVYKPYDKSDNSAAEKIVVEPCALKLFKRRWYLFARKRGKIDYSKSDLGYRTYALDRIVDIDTYNGGYFNYSANAHAFYKDYFGVITGDKDKGLFPAEDIVLKVRTTDRTNGKKHLYLENLPLHHSQQIDKNHESEGYWLFKYRLAPTFDFIQEILSHREDVEVLAPQSLREEVINALKKTLEVYK